MAIDWEDSSSTVDRTNPEQVALGWLQKHQRQPASEQPPPDLLLQPFGYEFTGYTDWNSKQLSSWDPALSSCPGFPQ